MEISENNIIKKLNEFEQDKCEKILLFSGGNRSLLLLYLIKKYKLNHYSYVHLFTGMEFEQIIHFIDKIERFFNIRILSLSSREFFFDENNLESCCEKNKFEPLFQRFEGDENRRFISGAKKKENDRLITVFYKHGLENLLFTPLEDIADDKIFSFLKDNSVPMCSLYYDEYNKTDCMNCTNQVHKNTKNDKDDELLIKEKLKKLGYL